MIRKKVTYCQIISSDEKSFYLDSEIASICSFFKQSIEQQRDANIGNELITIKV